MEQDWTTTTARDGMMRWTAPTSASAEDMSPSLSFTPPPTPPPKDAVNDVAAAFRVAPTVVAAPAPRRHNYSDSEPYVRPATRRVRRYASLSDLEDEAQFVAPTVPHTLPPKLALALAEIVETEFAYVAHLERLVNVYLAYLPSVLSTDAIVALVRNAGALLTLHARLANAIGADALTRAKVCQVLESYAADMGELYAEFCAGHHAAAAILRRAQERDPQLWAAWERDRASSASNAPGHRRRHSVDTAPSAPTSLALSFSDLLIMPVQRVCKYHLLVSSLLYSAGNDPEEPYIRSAVAATQGVAACVDEAQRLRESEDRARVVLERMDNHPQIAPGFIASLGPCILIGALDVLYYQTSSTKPPLVSMDSQTSSLTSSSTYPVYTSTAYATPSPGPHSQLGSPAYPSTPHPLPLSSSSVAFPQPTPAATPTAPHPLLALPKPPKAKHLAAFLWPGYLILCKVHPRRARYEPRHWFPLKRVASTTSAIREEVANVSDSGVSDCDPFEPSPDASPLFEEARLAPEAYPYSYSHSRSRSNVGHPSQSQLQTHSRAQSVRASPIVQQEGPTTGPGHVHVSANSAVFPFGVRISFGRHVFELGAACAEEQAVWLAAVEQARVVIGGEKEKGATGRELVLADKTMRDSPLAMKQGKELVTSTAAKPGRELVLASQRREEVEKSSAKVSRSKSATATLNASEHEREREAGGANLVRGRSEGSYVSERETSANGSLGLGIAERVESVFLKDRAGRASDYPDGYNAGTSPGGYNASLVNGSSPGSTLGVTRNPSASTNASRMPMRLSVISGPGGTFRGTLSSGSGGEGRVEGRIGGPGDVRLVGSSDARALVLADRTLGPADAPALTVSTGANVARTNSSSTGGSRSFPPSPVMHTHTLVHVPQSSSQVQGLQPPQTQPLQIQPHVQSLVQSSLSQPQTPHPHPTHSQPQTPHPNSQPQPQAALVVRRPSASARDIVDRALIDIFSRTCSEARMKGLRRGPLFPSPEDEAPTKPSSGTGITIGMGMGAIGMGMGMGKARPRRTSTALVGRNKSLLDALPGDRSGKDKEKEKEKKGTDAQPFLSEGAGQGSELHETEEGVVVGQSKTPLQRKRATIHGAMQTFPTMGPPSPAGEPEKRHMRGQSASAHGHSYAVQVVAPGGQVIHNGQAPKPQAPNTQQPAGQVNRNGSTASQRGPISPPRSRTVSSSGSFADGMRELFARRAFTKSAENVAVTSAHANAPTPVYSVGAGLSNTRSEEGLAPHVRPKAKASSAPALEDPEAGLYSLGAGITNTTTPPRKPKISTTGRSPGSGGKTGGGLLERSFAAFTKRRTRSGAAPLSALTFTPLNEKESPTSEERYSQTARSRSNEWYHPVPAIRGPPNRGMLGAELYTHPALRLQPSPVAEEGMFADFGDEVYDEERY